MKTNRRTFLKLTAASLTILSGGSPTLPTARNKLVSFTFNGVKHWIKPGVEYVLPMTARMSK